MRRNCKTRSQAKSKSTTRLTQKSQPTDSKRSPMSARLRGESRYATSKGVTSATKSKAKTVETSQYAIHLVIRGSMTHQSSHRCVDVLLDCVYRCRWCSSITLSSSEVRAPAGVLKSGSPGRMCVGATRSRCRWINASMVSLLPFLKAPSRFKGDGGGAMRGIAKGCWSRVMSDFAINRGVTGAFLRPYVLRNGTADLRGLPSARRQGAR